MLSKLKQKQLETIILSCVSKNMELKYLLCCVCTGYTSCCTPVSSCSSVAVYFIDKLALRAGNEKDSDETADTVGCCSLRVEHLSK